VRPDLTGTIMPSTLIIRPADSSESALATGGWERWESKTIYIVTLVIVLAVYLASPHRSVSFHYEQAAVRWLEGSSLYAQSNETGHGFLYLPQSAILHIPLAIGSRLSGWASFGDVGWRIGSWLALAYASGQFIRLDGPVDRRAKWITAICVSLLGVNCLRIGQSTLLLTALMLLALTALRWEQYTRSAVLLAIAVAVKPLAIVLVLLLFAISSPMRLRILLALVVVGAFPFLCQRPAYVMQQYVDCWSMLNTAAALGNTSNWAQLFGMLNFFGLPTSATFQTGCRLVAALMTLILAWKTSTVFPPQKGVTWLFSWAAIYLMLFNPRTENSTYCMLGPLLGLLITDSSIRPSARLRTVGLGVIAILIAGSYEIGKHFTPEGEMANWLAPLGCTLLLIHLLVTFGSELQRTSEQPLALMLAD
jgi:alpha-1,2-mannosyltransferase